MLEINRYRLNLYDLLYTKPLCDYMHGQGDVSEINVLFIGNGEKALETYKTMFWASQYPGSILKMTFAGTRSDIDYVNSMLSDKDKFPALEEYIEKGYANKLQYFVCNEIGSPEKVKENIEGLNIEKNLYCYIIIASGDAYLDWEYLSAIESVCEQNADILENVLIGIYNDGVNKKFADVNWNKVAKNVSVLQFEKAEEEVIKADLRRIAANINLAYSVMHDERLNIEDNFREFGKLCREEFDGTDTKKYNVDSSYASAVHISSKLTFCLQYMGVKKTENWRDEALKILSDSVKEENDLYKKLYYWEHKRWNAYTVMRGYRHPKKGEWGFVYSEGRKNVDTNNKLHVCLCESGDELNLDMNSASFWKKIKKELNPLDYASYYCNSIANSKTKELEKRIYSQYTFLNSIIFRELKEAIEDLFSEAGDANDNYKNVIKRFLNRSDIAADKFLIKELNKMNEELSIVIIRNQRINFFGNDAQLVRLIPFALWYGEKYQNVFVFSKGIAAKDVIVPTLLYAKKLYLVSDEIVSDKSKEIVYKYFMERGNNTDAVFITYEEMLRITSGMNEDEFVIAGEGELKEDYLTLKREIVNVRYDARNNVINNFNLFCGLNRQSFSVKEFIRLQGGDIKEESRDVFSKKTYYDYEKLFWNFSEKIKSGDYDYIPWNKVIKIFTKDSRKETKNKKKKVVLETENTLLESKNKKKAYICDTIIRQDKYIENLVDVFLTELYDYHLICNLIVSIEGENVRIRFITYHTEICKLIESYTKEDADCKMARLRWGKIIEKNSLIEVLSKKLSVVIENEKDAIVYRANQYKPLLEELKKLGAIDRYDVNGKQLISVTIKDMRILKLFEKEGDVFEKITFHRFKNSGMFNDLKNGVFFYWNREARDADIQRKKLKERISDVAGNDILNLIDADTYCEMNNEVFKVPESDYEENQVSNEIDVIAVRGMQAYFISCKAASEIKKEYLDEIANHSKNAGAIPVLAIGKSVGQINSAILSRAKELNHILILGREELNDQKTFDEILKKGIGRSI